MRRGVEVRRVSRAAIAALRLPRWRGTLSDVLAVRTAGSLVVLALLLVAPAARAECAKATALRPCQRVGKTSRLLPPEPLEVSGRPGARSAALVIGGIGVVLVGLAGFVLAAAARPACSDEYDHNPCFHAGPFFYGGLLAGVGGVVGGSGMLYYGALDAPVQHNQPVTSLTWGPRISRGASLSFRF